jgi:L-aspartate oxidase
MANRAALPTRAAAAAPPRAAAPRAAAPRAGALRAPRRAPRRARAAPAASAGASCDSGAVNSTGNAAAAANTPAVRHFDFLVLGSGIAGLSYALKVADAGTVAIVTKAAAAEGCTRYAQGGVCAVLDVNDSVEAHVRDTLVAGAFLNSLAAVEAVCAEGPARVLELAAFGAEFTRAAGGAFHLAREGGHSARRVVHAADATGAEVERALLAAARAHPRVAFFEHHAALDLVVGRDAAGARVALGADVLAPGGGAATRFLAPATLLATGGAGQVYPLTTNPGVATGDGVAMAARARAAVANMEFVQFHPTALYAPACAGYDAEAAAAAAAAGDGRAFLVTEAVRGEGGRLLSADGARRFMPGVDPRAELAPRDVVARAIHAEMAAAGSTHVLLDISHRPAAEVRAAFPTVAAHCAALGVDITAEPVPVVPAQHYMCGGVAAGLDGETTLAGLYACGEVACSGLHGANRLASNSLLEGLVFGARAAAAALGRADALARGAPRALAEAAAVAGGAGGSRAPRPLPAAAAAFVAAKRRALGAAMWSGAGIVRSRAGMRAALAAVAELDVEARALSEAYGASRELAELRNLVTVGELVLSSALQRRESRGGHFVVEHPAPVEGERRATVMTGPARRRLEAARARAPAFAGAPLPEPPGSPKRGGGRAARELSLTRSTEE